MSSEPNGAGEAVSTASPRRMRSVEIAPKSGAAFEVRTGETIRITDVEGAQVADLVAYNPENHAERLAQNFTRMYNGTTRLGPGGVLYSSLNNPMLRITHDTVGVHDMLYPPCNLVYYSRVYGIEHKTGCRDHLLSALEPFGLALNDVTDPFNIWMNTGLGSDGEPEIYLPKSQAGTFIELRAEMDLLVAVSACADDLSDCNAGRCTGLRAEILAQH